jgi:hypothetical protein
MHTTLVHWNLYCDVIEIVLDAITYRLSSCFADNPGVCSCHPQIFLRITCQELPNVLSCLFPKLLLQLSDYPVIWSY